MRNFGIKEYLFVLYWLLSMVKSELGWLKMELKIEVEIWRLYIPRSKLPCLEKLRYVQAVGFVCKLCSFIFLSICVLYKIKFCQHFFFVLSLVRFVICLAYLLRFVVLQRFSYCFHGVQIIMSDSINQMINKSDLTPVRLKKVICYKVKIYE